MQHTLGGGDADDLLALADEDEMFGGDDTLVGDDQLGAGQLPLGDELALGGDQLGDERADFLRHLQETFVGVDDEDDEDDEDGEIEGKKSAGRPKGALGGGSRHTRWTSGILLGRACMPTTPKIFRDGLPFQV